MRKSEVKKYKELLVSGILEFQVDDKFNRSKLETMPIPSLEKIYDSIDCRRDRNVSW